MPSYVMSWIVTCPDDAAANGFQGECDDSVGAIVGGFSGSHVIAGNIVRVENGTIPQPPY